MSEQSYSLPDFVILDDGNQSEISEPERRIVSEKFRRLRGNLIMGSFPDSIESNAPVYGVGLGAIAGRSLLLQTVSRNHQYWQFNVSTDITLDPPNPDAMSFEQISEDIGVLPVSDGVGQAYFAYQLGSDDVVRRWIESDVELTYEELTGGVHDDEVELLPSEISEAVNHEMANIRLEESMGLNFQPVGESEIDGLIAMIDNAELETVV